MVVFFLGFIWFFHVKTRVHGEKGLKCMANPEGREPAQLRCIRCASQRVTRAH